LDASYLFFLEEPKN